eukprot:scaffold102388_cov18-Prasinocladus_malaysianus.AAC.1
MGTIKRREYHIQPLSMLSLASPENSYYYFVNADVEHWLCYQLLRSRSINWQWKNFSVRLLSFLFFWKLLDALPVCIWVQ